MNTGICRWIKVTPLSVRRAPPVSSKSPFLDDLAAEAGGMRGRQRVGIKLVGVMRADHQQPALPLFPYQVLGQRVREHGARRRDMDQVGAAIDLAQPVVDRAGVEQHGSAITQRVGNLQQRVGGQVGNDVAVTVGQRRRRLDGIVAIAKPNLFQGKMLIKELAGGVVVVDGEAEAVATPSFSDGLFGSGTAKPSGRRGRDSRCRSRPGRPRAHGQAMTPMPIAAANPSDHGPPPVLSLYASLALT